MSIKIKVKDDRMEAPENKEPPKTKVKLDIRKTLDGNIIIQDHPYIDIIISPSKSKIIALSTIAMDDKVYYTQNKYFDFLYKRGVIDPSTSILNGGAPNNSLPQIRKDGLPDYPEINELLNPTASSSPTNLVKADSKQ